MTSRDFCYWLQGFFEISKPDTMTSAQIEMVQRHLNLVFKHEIDPSYGSPEHQAELQAVHDKLEKVEKVAAAAKSQAAAAPWDRPLIRC